MATYYVDGAAGNDSNAGTSTGAAWATIGHALATISGGDLVYVKASAIYSISSGLTFSTGTAGTLTRLIGYTTTPGDGGQATIQATAVIVALTMSGYDCRAENLVIDGNGLATQGIAITGANANVVVNCTVKNCTTYGCLLDGTYDGPSLVGVEVTGCSGTAAVYVMGAVGSQIAGCKIHGNTCTGIETTVNDVSILDCLIYGNTGSSSMGIYFVIDGSAGGLVWRNTIHGNGSDGIYVTNSFGNWRVNGIRNNILTSNGGYGINAPSLSSPTLDAATDYNWFGSGSLANTSGARSSNLQAGPHDLSGDPQYINASSGNFTPQNSAVQAAFPSGWIGAVQPASSGGGTTLVNWFEG